MEFERKLFESAHISFIMTEIHWIRCLWFALFLHVEDGFSWDLVICLWSPILFPNARLIFISLELSFFLCGLKQLYFCIGKIFWTEKRLDNGRFDRVRSFGFPLKKFPQYYSYLQFKSRLLTRTHKKRLTFDSEPQRRYEEYLGVKVISINSI